MQKRHEHINSADLIFIQPSILLTESSEADELTLRAQYILQRYVERERLVYKTQMQLADLIPVILKPMITDGISMHTVFWGSK